MKKLLTILFLLCATNVYSTPPVRLFTYTAGETILSGAVTDNEDAIFNYLTAGVDTYADDTIVNADIDSAANIQSDKLNLTSIAQAVLITSGGSLEVDGTSNLDGALDVDGATTLDGTVGITGALTVTGNSTFAGTTIANLGTVTTSVLTTADINGGTLDGVQIGGTTATGELIVNDSSDDADGLGDQGTAGQFLTSAGTGANPTWTSPLAVSAPSTYVTDFYLLGTDNDDDSGTATSYEASDVEITSFPYTGTIYIKAEICEQDSSQNASFKIYINDVASGSAQDANEQCSTYEDQAFGYYSITAGDKITVYGQAPTTWAWQAKNLRIYGLFGQHLP